jgi:dipeptidyl aminopeptidase/acylaminoacyl peptidase
MSLIAGTRLGPYEVLNKLGEGGMGVVYRATDTRLGRRVAIKVLPAAFSHDPDRRSRFEREARAIAALSHPNILAIHDVGTHDGQMFVVTELLEGETLRQRLAPALHGHVALPVRKAVEIATRLASGLAAAHEKGIVHRDLKPENVFLVADGQVKILDFGLARQAPSESAATETAAATRPGAVVGTVGYMAPEQVRGHAVDARTDLFALGAVLYEMLSGRRAFVRDTAAETMTAILREEPPDLTGTRIDLPAALDRIVRHCLEKNPAERFQTARDVAFALEALSGTGLNTPAAALPAVTPATRGQRRWLPVVLAAGLALVAGAAMHRSFAGASATVVTYEPKTVDPQWITNARFAPDGQTIVFSAAPTGGIPRLFVIRPDSISPEPIGDPGTHLLSISSKGELAVIVNASPIAHRLFAGTLARMTTESGAKPWMEDVREADWSPNGSSLAVIRIDGNRDRLEYPAGKVLYQTSGGYLSDPRVSPDGKKIAFFEHPVKYDNRGGVRVVDEAGMVAALADGYSAIEGLAWSADGRALFYAASSGGSNMQPTIVNVSGAPRPRLAANNPGTLVVFDNARDGRLLVSSYDESFSIRALVPGESAEREFPWLNAALFGFISADRRTLVFTDESASAGSNYAASVRPIAGGSVVRLGPGTAAEPSPDGRWVPSLTTAGDAAVLYPTGPGEPRTLAKGPLTHYEYFFRWFPDGRRAIVCGTETGKASRCYAQEVPDGVPTPITPEGVRQAKLSPDASRLLVTTTSDGYGVVPIGHSSPPIPIRGLAPDDDAVEWTSDGRAIVAVSRTVPAQVVRIDLATGTRTPLRELAPPDQTGVSSVWLNQWIDDGPGYTYTYFRTLSKLFVATGVQP